MWKALIKLVEKWGCHHDYDLVHQSHVDGGEYSKTYTSLLYHCPICGNFKKVKSS